jgi:hypothetical protein
LTASGLTVSGGFVQWGYVENISHLKGKPVTLSAKADDRIYAFTATVPKVFASGEAFVKSLTKDNIFLGMHTLISGTKEMLLVIFGTASGSSSPSVYEYIKLEEGSIATPLVSEDPAIALMRCQRLFEKSYNLDVAPGAITFANAPVLAPSADGRLLPGVSFKVTKRAVPAIKIYAPDGTPDMVMNVYSHEKHPVRQIWNPARNGFQALDLVVNQSNEAIGTPLDPTKMYTYHWVADANI